MAIEWNGEMGKDRNEPFGGHSNLDGMGSLLEA